MSGAEVRIVIGAAPAGVTAILLGVAQEGTRVELTPEQVDATWPDGYIGWYPGPWPLFKKLETEQDWYLSLGFTGVLPEYRDRNMDTDAHMWLTWKLSWNKDARVDDLLRTFYSAYYGAAAETGHFVATHPRRRDCPMAGRRSRRGYNRLVGECSPRPPTAADRRARRSRIARIARALGFVGRIEYHVYHGAAAVTMACRMAYPDSPEVNCHDHHHHRS